MDRLVYEDKLSDLVGDGSTYKKLRRDPTTTVEKKIAELVRQLHHKGYIPDVLKDQLTPSYSNLPQIYGLPKIHKEDTPQTYCVCYRFSYV